jgi:ubiquinone/menaquinone biosynthesis C-methylase UbiE
MIVKEQNFMDEYVRVWDEGALKDAPFITLGIEVLLKDYYGDLLDAPPPFPVEKGQRVLDLGCGWGRVLKPVCDRGAKAVGFDISLEMLKLADAHLRRNRCRAGLVRGDGTRLPFAGSTFDLVYSLLVLQHLSKDNGREIFREISRVLRPGGAAYVRVPGRLAPENLLFSLLQFISIHVFRYRDPIRMRFYRVGELRKMCEGLFSEFEVTGHEFRPPWNFHTKWTWHYILVPRFLHRPLRKISDRIERAANTKYGFLKNFGVVLMVRVKK